mmetsp:Transcript_9372/g.18010  ORF Transcript_9372/g.18010 Transcript_9372/m.18010 type:complete len:109 (+) Transcript_9372:34-360(+)
MSNEIRVSNKRPFNFYVREARDKLKELGTVELHGLGEAISASVRVADALIHYKYADMQRFETQTLDDSSVSEHPLPKVVVRLTKAATFDQAYEEFIKTRASSDRLKAN